jgi:hypothetical protein
MRCNLVSKQLRRTTSIQRSLQLESGAVLTGGGLTVVRLPLQVYRTGIRESDRRSCPPECNPLAAPAYTRTVRS